MLKRLTHQALKLACARADRNFRGQGKQLEQVQRQKLQQTLQQVANVQGKTRSLVPTWEEFAHQRPVTRYAQWQEQIHAQRPAINHMHIRR